MEFSEKQIQIIEVTEKLFAEKGYEGSSVRDIAQNAGVNVAMISYYFGSKEKLFQSVFAHRISLSKLALENLLYNKEMTPTDKINRLIDNYVNKIMDNPSFHRINIPEQMNKDMKDITNLIYANKMQNLQLVTRIVEEGQQKNEFVKDVDVAMLLVTMIGTASHVINNLDYFKIMYGMGENVPDHELMVFTRKKLTTHLKHIFKAVLSYEGK